MVVYDEEPWGKDFEDLELIHTTCDEERILAALRVSMIKIAEMEKMAVEALLILRRGRGTSRPVPRKEHSWMRSTTYDILRNKSSEGGLRVDPSRRDRDIAIAGREPIEMAAARIEQKPAAKSAPVKAVVMVQNKAKYKGARLDTQSVFKKKQILKKRRRKLECFADQENKPKRTNRSIF